MSNYAKVRSILEQHKKGLMVVNEAIEEISAMLGIPLIPDNFDNPFEVGRWVRWVGNSSGSTNLDEPCQNGQCVGKVTDLAERTTWVKWERTCALHHKSNNTREPVATDCLRVVVNPHMLGDLLNWPGKPKTDNRCKSVSEGIRCTSVESHNLTEPAHVGSNGYVWYEPGTTPEQVIVDIFNEVDELAKTPIEPKADIPWVSPGPSESDIAEQAERVRKANAWVETGVWNTAPQRAFNDPKVDCCGRDVADCDCPDIADELDKEDITVVVFIPSNYDWSGETDKRDVPDNIVLSVN